MTALVDAVTVDTAMYSSPLEADRSGPFYNAVSYPTKIAPETVALFIASHTRPGQTVLDPFCGSGSTGVAARLCDQPTERMVRMAATRGLQPTWGPRDAVLYDIGVFPALISQVMGNPPDPREFFNAAEATVRRAAAITPGLYSTIDDRGSPGEIRHVIWSEFIECPGCGKRARFADVGVGGSPLRMVRRFSCTSCRWEDQVSKAPRGTEEILDPLLNTTIVRRRREPTIVYGRTGRRTWRRLATDSDVNEEVHCLRKARELGAPLERIRWGDLKRAGYHKGISHLHHFYTPRNFLAVSALFAAIDSAPQELRDALRLLVLSFNQSHATLMTRVVVKKASSDFVVTGAQSGVLYVSGLPLEKNVYAGVLRKARVFAEAFAATAKSESRVLVRNQSSEHIELADESVDYVFTDPPFGDFIPYAEVNQVNEVWLGQRTEFSDELIVSPGTGRPLERYGDGLSTVFCEVRRTLKPHGMATIIFHSSKSAVWNAVAGALTNARLRILRTSLLDRTQPSFKQAADGISVRGDAIILTTKGETDAGPSLGSPVRSDSDEAAPSHRYTQYVVERLEADLPVELGAREFHQHSNVSKAT